MSEYWMMLRAYSFLEVCYGLGLFVFFFFQREGTYLLQIYGIICRSNVIMCRICFRMIQWCSEGMGAKVNDGESCMTCMCNLTILVLHIF